MSQTSGFFNAEQLSDGSYDRVYIAQQFAEYFSRFIGNGVFVTPATQLKVVQQETPSMGISVKVGDAYVNGYWYKNDGVYNIKLSNANGTTERIDLIVLRLDYSKRSIYLTSIEGTPNSSPVEPSYIRNEDYYDLVLASVRIGKAVTTITDEVITDRRNNNNYCGYVAGVVSQIDTTDLFSQFTAAFNSWFAELKESIKYDTDRFTVLFDAWFDSIKGKLEGDQATALQLQIDALTESTTKGIYGFENKQTIENSDGSISEIYGDGRKVVTVEESDGSITQKYYDSSGSLKYTKTIVEDSTGKITETII